MEPPRIGFVIGDYLPDVQGGAQLHVRDLCRGLAARGHEVAIFAGRRGRDQAEYACSSEVVGGARVTRVTYNFLDLDRFDLLYANPKLDACFADWLHSFAPDLVHFHHLSGLSTNMVRVAAAVGLPVVLTLHDFWLVCPRGQRIHPDTVAVCDPIDRAVCLPCLSKLWPHLLEPEGAAPAYRLRRWEDHVRRMLGLADVILAPSAFHRERFVEWGTDPARTFAVPHGLSREGFEDLVRPDRPLRAIGFIGTVLPSKGVHVLVDAFRRLGRSDLVLHVHGAIPDYHGDTTYRERLEAAARGLAVRIHGPYDHADLPRILAALDILVVPSLWWESFCLTIREGALAGIPVVCSAHGAMLEAVMSGLALGFEPGDAGDLARVLGRLLDDPELRARMSRRGDLVRDLADCVAATEDLYARAMRRRAERA